MTAVPKASCDLLASQDATKGFKTYRVYLYLSSHSGRIRLEAIAKEIYMETALTLNAIGRQSEQKYRTAVSTCMVCQSRLALSDADYPLESEPTSSQFIEIISSYTIRSHQARLQLSVCRDPLLVPLRTYDRLLFRRHFSDSGSPREHREKHP